MARHCSASGYTLIKNSRALMWKWFSTLYRVLLRKQPMEKSVETGRKGMYGSISVMENEFSSRNSSKFGGVLKFHYIPLNQLLQCWILASLIYFPSNPNYSCIFSTSHIITKIKNLQLRKMTHFCFQLKYASSSLPYAHPFLKHGNYIL